MRTNLNIKRPVIENKHLEKGKNFKIQPHRIELRKEISFLNGSLFINILIKR
jgi:hypothetical protein